MAPIYTADPNRPAIAISIIPNKGTVIFVIILGRASLKILLSIAGKVTKRVPVNYSRIKLLSINNNMLLISLFANNNTWLFRATSSFKDKKNLIIVNYYKERFLTLSSASFSTSRWISVKCSDRVNAVPFSIVNISSAWQEYLRGNSITLQRHEQLTGRNRKIEDFSGCLATGMHSFL